MWSLIVTLAGAGMGTSLKPRRPATVPARMLIVGADWNFGAAVNL